jgi:hypothetical protein
MDVTVFKTITTTMKQIFFLLGIVVLISASACKKSSSDNSTPSGTFKFTGLVTNDTVIPVDGLATITAVATGEELTYTWSCDFGTFIGSGATVQWTVCHADNFTINCTVTDKNKNSATKNVIIRTHV